MQNEVGVFMRRDAEFALAAGRHHDVVPAFCPDIVRVGRGPQPIRLKLLLRAEYDQSHRRQDIQRDDGLFEKECAELFKPLQQRPSAVI